MESFSSASPIFLGLQRYRALAENKVLNLSDPQSRYIALGPPFSAPELYVLIQFTAFLQT